VILVDTSVWIDHLRHGNQRLAQSLHDAQVLVHPFVIGEMACGTLRARREILSLLARLPTVRAVSHEEALHFLETRTLSGRGLGWIDMHLVAAAVASRVAFWTLDRRLAAVYSLVAT
jgi:predicted nucleic acid-binding protein